MMRRIAVPLPWPGVTALVGRFGIPGAESRLSPQMQRVHQSRCARALAIDLLDAQGATVEAIGKGPVGEPIWPDGFVGSLAHTECYAAAVIARQGDVAALGIDIEPAIPLPEDILDRVLTAGEREWANAVAETIPAATRLLLCAKHCVHKALHPLRGVWLDFNEVGVTVDLVSGAFVPHPVTAEAVRAFQGLRAEGSWRMVEGQQVAVLAFVSIPTRSGATVAGHSKRPTGTE